MARGFNALLTILLTMQERREPRDSRRSCRKDNRDQFVFAAALPAAWPDSDPDWSITCLK
jgi:hypothetical protein